MRHLKLLCLCFLGISVGFCSAASAKELDPLFPTMESRKQFASEISSLIEKSWKNWQDSIRIDDVDVEGGQGFFMPGEIAKPILSLSKMMKIFDRKNRTQNYILAVKAVLGSVENGMRAWQRGYTHKNIPFPRGASCMFTMTPSNNVPVTLASGESFGDRLMTEDGLYSYVLYRVPKSDDNVLIVFRAAAKAISECFDDWKKDCFIVGIMASGGIAPNPAMGFGPGPVRGAKGKNGRLKGAYFDRLKMKQRMIKYIRGGSRTAL